MSVADVCTVHPMQEQQRLYGGLLMVRLLARKYEFKDDDEREPLAHIVSATFPALLAIFQVVLVLGFRVWQRAAGDRLGDASVGTIANLSAGRHDSHGRRGCMPSPAQATQRSWQDLLALCTAHAS